jgi:hypothetical protein
MPALNRTHYSGDYARRAAAIRAAAYADPNTRCGRCGLTLAAIPGATWDAGHVHDGIPDSPLRPEHSTCNRTAGARLGTPRRLARRLNTSRQW